MGGAGGPIKPINIMTPTHNFTGAGGPSNTTSNSSARQQQLVSHGMDGLKRMIADLENSND